MKFKKKAIKLALAELALLTALLITQMGIQFASSYKWIGFAKKDEQTWISIAETAEADNNQCQSDLDIVKAEKDQAIFANNPDLK